MAADMNNHLFARTAYRAANREGLPAQFFHRLQKTRAVYQKNFVKTLPGQPSLLNSLAVKPTKLLKPRSRAKEKSKFVSKNRMFKDGSAAPSVCGRRDWAGCRLNACKVSQQYNPRDGTHHGLGNGFGGLNDTFTINAASSAAIRVEGSSLLMCPNGATSSAERFCPAEIAVGVRPRHDHDRIMQLGSGRFQCSFPRTRNQTIELEATSSPATDTMSPSVKFQICLNPSSPVSQESE